MWSWRGLRLPMALEETALEVVDTFEDSSIIPRIPFRPFVNKTKIGLCSSKKTSVHKKEKKTDDLRLTGRNCQLMLIGFARAKERQEMRTVDAGG